MNHNPEIIKVMVLGLRGFPNVQGGVEKHAEELYPILVKLGCQVEVISRSHYSYDDTSWKGISFHRVWAPRLNGLEAFVHSFIGVIYASIFRPDILHVHAIGPAIVVPLARLLGLKVVVTHHGPDYDREKWGYVARWLLRLGERWGMRYSNGRIVISEVIRKLVYEKYHVDSAVIHNGVTLPNLPSTSDMLRKYSLTSGKYILLVSRFVPEKRHLDLIEAFNRINQSEWKLVLVGDFDQKDKYCKRVLFLSEQVPGVVITGYQTGDALKEIYANAGIFILPSSHEGLPIALLEALSYGLPVIVSDIPANKEIGLAENCYFRMGDIGDLVDKLQLHFSNINVDIISRDNRREWLLNRYNWMHAAHATLEIYKKARL